MLRNYKKPLILTSLLILLPIPVGLLLWDRFPAQMAVHWGITGQPDSWAGPVLTVIAMPLLMLALHLLCFFFTLRDPGNHGRNRKPLALVLWIVPLICNLSCYSIYALALGKEFHIVSLTLAVMGILFAILGNYMPKTRMNATMGIKVPWTYTSEENWNATHRFAGKIWVIGGVLILFTVFFPEAAAIAVFFVVMLVLTIVPVVYSWRFWKRQTANGAAVKPFPKAETAITKGALILLIILILFVLSVLFLGSIKMEFRENYLYIDPSCYNSYVLEYDAIQSVEYREGNVDGLRVGGYGSFRLLMGYFKNEEFGTYIRYTYYKPGACVVVSTTGKTLVLSGETREETQVLYQELLARTEK